MPKLASVGAAGQGGRTIGLAGMCSRRSVWLAVLIAALPISCAPRETASSPKGQSDESIVLQLEVESETFSTDRFPCARNPQFTMLSDGRIVYSTLGSRGERYPWKFMSCRLGRTEAEQLLREMRTLVSEISSSPDGESREELRVFDVPFVRIHVNGKDGVRKQVKFLPRGDNDPSPRGKALRRLLDFECAKSTVYSPDTAAVVVSSEFAEKCSPTKTLNASDLLPARSAPFVLKAERNRIDKLQARGLRFGEWHCAKVGGQTFRVVLLPIHPGDDGRLSSASCPILQPW